LNIQNSNESSSTLKNIHSSIRNLDDSQKLIDDQMNEALATVKIVSDDFSRIDDRIHKVEEKQVHDMVRRHEVERKVKSFEGLAKTTEQDIIRARNQNDNIENNLKIVDNSVGKINE